MFSLKNQEVYLQRDKNLKNMRLNEKKYFANNRIYIEILHDKMSTEILKAKNITMYC